MTDAEEMSPEEKLLKVIQEPEDAVEEQAAPAADIEAPVAAAEDTPEEAAAEDAVSEPEAEADEGKKPELKLQEPAVGKGAEASEDGKPKLQIDDVSIGKDLEVPETGSGKIGAGNILAEEKKKPAAKLGIKTVNKFLAVAAIIAICFIGWEAVSYQLQFPQPVDIRFVDKGEGIDEIEDIASSEAGLVDIEKVLSDYRKNPIVLFPGVVEKTTVTQVQRVGPVVPQSDWAKYAKANLKMKGRSRLPADQGFMAVMSDAKSGKMHFLKVGDKVMLEKQMVEVKEVGARFVKFNDGTIELTVE